MAKKFVKELHGGEVIGLIGNLGAGKTVFTKGLAKGLKINKRITSPTFVLMRVYPVSKNKAIKFFIHIDAYRIKSPNDLLAIGANEYFGRVDSVVVIEWADKIKKILPKKTRFIYLEHKNKSRLIKL